MKQLITVITRETCINLLQQGKISVKSDTCCDTMNQIISKRVEEMTGFNSMNPVRFFNADVFVKHSILNTEILMDFFPINSKDSIVIIARIPEDMILVQSSSVETELNLVCYHNLDNDDTEYVISQLKERVPADSEDTVYYAPYLDKSWCKMCLCLNENFETEENLMQFSSLTIEQLKCFE